jgi:hypothetical protein
MKKGSSKDLFIIFLTAILSGCTVLLAYELGLVSGWIQNGLVVVLSWTYWMLKLANEARN